MPRVGSGYDPPYNIRSQLQKRVDRIFNLSKEYFKFTDLLPLQPINIYTCRYICIYIYVHIIFIYVYIYMYIYIYIHLYLFICINLYIYIHIHIYVCMCISCIHIHMYIYICIYIRRYIYISTYMYIEKFAYMIYTCVYIYTYVCKYIHICNTYIYICIQIYVQIYGVAHISFLDHVHRQYLYHFLICDLSSETVGIAWCHYCTWIWTRSAADCNVSMHGSQLQLWSRDWHTRSKRNTENTNFHTASKRKCI